MSARKSNFGRRLQKPYIPDRPRITSADRTTLICAGYSHEQIDRMTPGYAAKRAEACRKNGARARTANQGANKQKPSRPATGSPPPQREQRKAAATDNDPVNLDRRFKLVEAGYTHKQIDNMGPRGSRYRAQRVRDGLAQPPRQQQSPTTGPGSPNPTASSGEPSACAAPSGPGDGHSGREAVPLRSSST